MSFEGQNFCPLTEVLSFDGFLGPVRHFRRNGEVQRNTDGNIPSRCLGRWLNFEFKIKLLSCSLNLSSLLYTHGHTLQIVISDLKLFF